MSVPRVGTAATWFPAGANGTAAHAPGMARPMLIKEACRRRISCAHGRGALHYEPPQRLHVGSVSAGRPGPRRLTELTVDRPGGRRASNGRCARSSTDTASLGGRRASTPAGIPHGRSAAGRGRRTARAGGRTHRHAARRRNPLGNVMIDGSPTAGPPSQRGPSLHGRRGERGAAPRGAHRSRVTTRATPGLRPHAKPRGGARGAPGRRSRRCPRRRAGRSNPPRSSRSTPPSPPGCWLRWPSLSLERLLAVRGAVGCKVNDVILSVVTGGLRRWLATHAVSTDRLCVRAMVPVSMRTPGDHLTLGNLVSAMFPILPIDIADPVERLHRVSAHMSELKERGQAHATGLLMALAGTLPAPLSAPRPHAAELADDQRGVHERARSARATLHPRAPHPGDPSGRAVVRGARLGFAILSYADYGLHRRIRRSSAGARRGRPVTDAIAAELDALVASLGLGAASPRRGTAAGVPARRRSHDGRGAYHRPRDLARRGLAAHAAHAHPACPGGRHAAASRRRRHAPRPPLRHAQRHGPAAGGVATAPARVAQRTRGDGDTSHRRNPDEPAAAAGQRMLAAKIGCLPVVDGTGRLAGIVTEEDFLRWATSQMAPPAANAA